MCAPHIGKELILHKIMWQESSRGEALLTLASEEAQKQPATVIGIAAARKTVLELQVKRFRRR